MKLESFHSIPSFSVVELYLFEFFKKKSSKTVLIPDSFLPV